MTWNPADLPLQPGRVAAVSGANAGIGFWTAYALAGTGASVQLLARNPERADAAMRAIRAHVPSADLTVVPLDVADLASVREAGSRLADLPRLDVLVNNAGIVHAPKRRDQTADGLELVTGTNFFGAFALTAAALPALERTPGSRVVSLGSLATLLVRLNTDDLQQERGRYSGWTAYASSKVMLSSFGFELDRRLVARGSVTRSLVAHPGYSISGRTRTVPGVNEPSRLDRFVDILQTPFTQSKERGAEPVVRAAIDPAAEGGTFYGPKYLVKGESVELKPAQATRDPRVAAAVWAEAEVATGVQLL
ncbi:NAD(P)-dependent dehydrogenase (short-subunit alcohol dehydrogenase family) [Okibacterium sp. HSC-33S16]|uniref:SDR family NAD(P)-dependent oxidoreductase n=1 Tax=Okibacterium sp. HSC-33S16 TaxID=2910965 RepID=UPI0020A085B1|nr:SDR family NAD(P)-dependent oxidoreductase [Okibacterium sp. HSC-33S16]MCP2031457.1 NAD(P)-dependent dehydrogenase (short-subunit alcohol dehydrogenase family) [Okibacterium sp. HSC-33S16]